MYFMLYSVKAVIDHRQRFVTALFVLIKLLDTVTRSGEE